MFTGLIEDVGAVVSLTRSGANQRLTIRSAKLVPQLRKGDSVCVNGVCLTALDITAETVSADLAAETVARTSLIHLVPDSPVNLELPTRAGTPLGGHVVQGHVDDVGTIKSFTRLPGADDWQLVVSLPAHLQRYVVAQGSIAIDGISLTVAAISANDVSIAIIPHTYSATNLSTRKTGDLVNIEVDVLAKYSEKRNQASSLTVEDLLAQGF
jgi:riboflavin synthase